VLQVHHKFYFAGRLPWQYLHNECEALCRGCHAEEHGLVRPKSGWQHFGFSDDLGAPDGECELCGTSIRYVFPVYHEKWGTMEVGEICCDHLTSSTFATEYMTVQRKRLDRRKRFVSSSRWDKSGSLCIVQKNAMVCVVREGAAFRLHLNRTPGNLKFDSALEAKIKAFDLFETGAAERFLQKMRHMQPDQLGFPQQTNAVGREHRRIQNTLKEFCHNRTPVCATSNMEPMVRDSGR
jgi:hypothetical protein